LGYNTHMEFIHRAEGRPERLGIFPGTFNPVTVAHLALASFALQSVHEVVFVLPRLFPHKSYSGASFDERVEMLRSAVADLPGVSIASTRGGLFADIAAECRAVYGERTRLTFLCGRDAAERVAGWDYGNSQAFPDMLRTFDLMVARREGDYEPPPHLREAIETIRLDSGYSTISATEVRDRIAAGQQWEHLVPAAIRDRARLIYRATAAPSPTET
jgi:nicotinate-nucleotide adenylyltransferase